MPKAPRLKEESQLSPSTLEYLQRLRNIKEEFEVLDLIEPQYEYPVTAQVFTPVVYLKANGAPYNFRKRISKATKHSCIDITHCPPETLAYHLDTFPGSDISFTRTNLLIPYVPTTKAIARAYKVLPVDTVIEYEKLLYLQYRDQSDTSDSTTDSMAEHQLNHESPLNVPEPLPSIKVQPPTPQTNFNNALPSIQGLNLGTQIDPTIVAAVIAALQTAGIGAQAQPKATKMKIKEPEKYDGKNRGGDANWRSFKKAFITAFGDPDKEGTAIRKLESLTQGNRPAATYAADFRRLKADIAWNEQAFMHAYQQGLRADVKDGMVYHNKPDTLEKLIALTIRIDDRLWERKQEKS
ncbi:hypothetical protein FS837_008059, partial [Tulasnella sp. UAMH 9824]